MITTLRGKTAVITGGSRGIGYAIAQTFVAKGARVYLVARNGVALQRAVESLNFDRGERARCIVGDVSLERTWHRIVAQVRRDAEAVDKDALAEGERPLKPHTDILVNAAGTAQASLLFRTPVEELDRIVNTNLRSTILGCRIQGADMWKRVGALKASRNLNIINVASVMATHGQRGATVYAASKAGILGLTTALAREYGPVGIRVNAILPGWINTDMSKNMLRDALAKDLKNRIPLERPGEPEEVADAAAFLACNSYVNGCHLTVDGGLTGGY